MQMVSGKKTEPGPMNTPGEYPTAPSARFILQGEVWARGPDRSPRPATHRQAIPRCQTLLFYIILTEISGSTWTKKAAKHIYHENNATSVELDVFTFVVIKHLKMHVCIACLY